MKAICGLSVFLLTLGSLLGAAENAASSPGSDPGAESPSVEQYSYKALQKSLPWALGDPQPVAYRATSEVSTQTNGPHYALEDPDKPKADQDALILRILKAVEIHDYHTLLIYTLDKETDYFGHKNSPSAFIQQI